MGNVDKVPHYKCTTVQEEAVLLQTPVTLSNSKNVGSRNEKTGAKSVMIKGVVESSFPPKWGEHNFFSSSSIENIRKKERYEGALDSYLRYHHARYHPVTESCKPHTTYSQLLPQPFIEHDLGTEIDTLQ